METQPRALPEQPDDESTATQPPEQPDRSAQPVDTEQPPRLSFPVVGIGGSAGGLEAFTQFFDAVPPDTGMAFVVVQHLPPDRESLVAEILGRRTRMPVAQVENGMPVEMNHVYVIRPGRTLTIQDGHLHLGEPVEKPRHTRPVDDFFRSLAEEQRERSIAIVMSGMGSNGTIGAENIKAVGGVIMAQDPDSAQFPSMPRAIIDSGLADFIMRPEQMPEVLRRFAAHPYATEHSAVEPSLQRDRLAFNEILALLRTRARQDFTGYKKPTVLRRIQRRMGLHQIVDLIEYAKLMRTNPSEAQQLADDLVIHVSGFFRDPQAWESLAQHVLQPMIAQAAPDSSIRAWVVACAGGEEAYTLAMLLSEAAETREKPLDIKIFATDIADRTLQAARGGTYAGGIESEISPARLERFFHKENGYYRVRRELREMVVFAPQNILQDPPFSRLDLCTCRNLLIYLEPEVQRRVLTLLHFGIREGGTLFLGNSETATGADNLFEAIDPKWRIFRRIGPTRHGILPFSLRVSGIEPQPAQVRTMRAPIAHQVQQALLDRFTPPAVVIDGQQRVIFFHGDATRFLAQPAGEPTRDVLAMAREGVRGALRTAVHKALETREPFSARDGVLQSDEGRMRVTVSVAPLDHKPLATSYLITFETYPEPEVIHLPGDGDQQAMEELQRLKDELQSAVEELQTANEELTASNEEVTSINEELQSTNEELETSKEELQSLNEELTTVNTQLQAKMEELEGTGNDLSALLSSTDIAVIFLDRHFRIRRFTPAVRNLVELLQSDVGRPLSDLAQKFADPHLMQDARTVLEKLIPIEREVNASGDTKYIRRVLPYRTLDNRIDGVVLTFMNITIDRRKEKELRESEEKYRLIVESVTDFVIFMMGPDGTVASWNSGGERILGFSASQIIGKHGRIIFTPEDRANGESEKELARAAENGASIDERWHVRKDGERFWGSGMVTAVKTPDGTLRGFVKVMRDNTDRKITEEQLQEARRLAEQANAAKDEFLAVVSHELRTPLSAILLWSKMIQSSNFSPDELKHGIRSIESSAEAQKQLIEDLLDTTRISSGSLRLNLRETDLQAVMKAAVAAIRPTAVDKGISIGDDYGEEIGIVQADSDRLQQVVWNLLSNAVKFTPPGGHVEVALARAGSAVEIRVSDTGKGIAPEFLPLMFDRFKQEEGTITRSQGGLGLGLAIAKQLVELHGGTITAQSAGLDRGATFHVRLPLPRIRKTRFRAAADLVATDASKHPLKGVNILLVEDNLASAEAMKVLLSRLGAQITLAASGAAAVRSFAESRPTLLISDIAMPDMDGYTLIRKIRQIERDTNSGPLPAVALSAFTREEDRSKAIDAGFDQHISKPLDTQKFVGTLVELLREG